MIDIHHNIIIDWKRLIQKYYVKNFKNYENTAEKNSETSPHLTTHLVWLCVQIAIIATLSLRLIYM